MGILGKSTALGSMSRLAHPYFFHSSPSALVFESRGILPMEVRGLPSS